MFIIVLRFGPRRDTASDHMAGHNQWLSEGFADGTFVLAGSIQPSAGGVVLALGESAAAVQARVQRDPFVAHQVVVAEIIEVAPGMVDPRMAFLQAGATS